LTRKKSANQGAKTEKVHAKGWEEERTIPPVPGEPEGVTGGKTSGFTARGRRIRGQKSGKVRTRLRVDWGGKKRGEGR